MNLDPRYADNTGSAAKLLRKGQVGDWQNWLSVAQSKVMDEADRKLAHTVFKFRYSLT